MGCLEEHEIAAFAGGRMLDRDRAAIDRHLDGCPACLELVAHAARLVVGSAVTATDNVTGASPPPNPWSQRYELRERIATGGMGIIFAAYDHQLQRTVAIKCARDPHPALAARFAREVQLTARLQHPTIIAIHDSGRLPDGRAFYAMPRILGQPLDRRIAAATTLDERLGLLPHVIALVDAVAYVHDQGILHRDLKPHNVLVGEFGETVLVDWGLAKPIAEVGGGGLSAAGHEAAAPSGSVDAAGAAPGVPGPATAAGAVLGTRGYMAPEQAQGSAVDRRADVYGLGATLLHLITGRPPLEAPRGGREGPPDLLAIAVRAMAPRPEERYASARELADDLHRFHTGRLVQAHRYSAAQRLRRWVGQHRGIVGLATAALVAIALISAAAIRGVVAEREVAQAERAVAQAERQRAEEHRDAAQGLVRFALGELRDQLDQVGRLDALSGVAGEVAAYYERVSSWANRPSDLQQRAAAFGWLGEVRRARGDAPGAVAMLRQSVALAREAAHANPGAAADLELCRALVLVGESSRDVGLPEATSALAECEAIARRRLDGEPGFRALLARVLVELGNDAKRRGAIAEAQRRFEEAQAIGTALEAAGDGRGARAVLRGAAALGQMWMEHGDWGAAAAPTAAFLAAAQREVASRPHDVKARTALALSWQRTGDLHTRQRSLALAEHAYQQGYRITAAAVALEPDNMRWLRNLGVFEQSLAVAARARRDLAAAVSHSTASRDIAAKLAQRDPSQADLQANLAAGELDVGDDLLASGKVADVRRAYDHALEIWQALHRASPSNEGERSVAVILLHIARLERAVGRRDAARVALERSAAGTRRVLATGEDAEARRYLVEAMLELARVTPARAATYVRDAVAVCTPLRGLAASDPELAALVADVDRASSSTRR